MLVFQDRSIIYQGQLENMERRAPEVYQSFQQTVHSGLESASGNGTDDRHIEEERRLLQKQVAKHMMEEQASDTYATLACTGKLD